MSQIDKYNLQISILQIIQKSYQYALAMMKYRAEFARQQAELDYYKGIYGEALKVNRMQSGSLIRKAD